MRIRAVTPSKRDSRVVPSRAVWATTIQSGRGTLPRTLKKLKHPSKNCGRTGRALIGHDRVDQHDLLGLGRRTDEAGAAGDADLRGGQAHAAAVEVVAAR